MQIIQLAADTYFCEYEDNAVFLNLVRDRYYAVDAHGVRQLRRCVLGWPRGETAGAVDDEASDSTDSAAVDELLTLKVLTKSSNHGKPAVPITITSCVDSFPVHRDDVTTRPCLDDLIVFLCSLAVVTISLNVFGVKSAIGRMIRLQQRGQRGATAADGTSKVTNLTARFFRLRLLFYTARNKCLFDSLVCWEFLRRWGFPSTFVIGVKMKPFGAHAWVQWGDLILTDAPEMVSNYRPLLVHGRGDAP